MLGYKRKNQRTKELNQWVGNHLYLPASSCQVPHAQPQWFSFYLRGHSMPFSFSEYSSPSREGCLLLTVCFQIKHHPQLSQNSTWVPLFYSTPLNLFCNTESLNRSFWRSLSCHHSMLEQNRNLNISLTDFYCLDSSSYPEFCFFF